MCLSAVGNSASCLRYQSEVVAHSKGMKSWWLLKVFIRESRRRGGVVGERLNGKWPQHWMDLELGDRSNWCSPKAVGV